MECLMGSTPLPYSSSPSLGAGPSAKFCRPPFGTHLGPQCCSHPTLIRHLPAEAPAARLCSTVFVGAWCISLEARLQSTSWSTSHFPISPSAPYRTLSPSWSNGESPRLTVALYLLSTRTMFVDGTKTSPTRHTVSVGLSNHLHFSLHP